MGGGRSRPRTCLPFPTAHARKQGVGEPSALRLPVCLSAVQLLITIYATRSACSAVAHAFADAPSLAAVGLAPDVLINAHALLCIHRIALLYIPDCCAVGVCAALRRARLALAYRMRRQGQPAAGGPAACGCRGVHAMARCDCITAAADADAGLAAAAAAQVYKALGDVHRALPTGPAHSHVSPVAHAGQTPEAEVASRYADEALRAVFAPFMVSARATSGTASFGDPCAQSEWLAAAKLRLAAVGECHGACTARAAV